ncbi:fatty acid-binding protein, liver-like [Saccoglossus kowalevskii]|uniref:Fatty acid-binding protein, liver-like n=1 Tax=Saccoglossus kowalevskii TaxID=10224 RepID=A0ABM0M8Q3_SACKO|nr:PREDICTED: fatty acid-binding protein, liver-like [Saccoglossus kowalevskii]
MAGCDTADLVGKWELVRHENSEALFAAIGVPEELRQKMAAIKNTMDIQEQDGDWVITETTFPGQPDRVQKFRLGQEEELPTLFGKRKCIVTLEGGKLMNRSANPEEPIEFVGCREVINGELVVKAILPKKDVVGTAYYAKIG